MVNNVTLVVNTVFAPIPAVLQHKTRQHDCSVVIHTGRRVIALVNLRKFVAEELSDKYTVIEACNGVEAMDLLEKHNIQIIVTDLMMPMMDGMSLCRFIKGDIRLCHIPVVVLTAKVSMSDHIEALDAKAEAFIEKPFSIEHLRAQISNLLRGRDLLRSTFIHSPYALVSGISSNKADNQFIARLDKLVNDHIDSDMLSVEFLAEHMAMSKSSLYRKVKSLTSLSPNDYIKLCRLKRAAKMLKDEGVSIKEVAERTGFSSAAYFTSCFMKQFGITPGEFLRSN